MTIDARSFFTGNPTPVPTSTEKTAWAYVDEHGRLVLPPEVAAQSGLAPGARMRLEPTRNGLRLHRSVTHLAKVYVEPTNACNLDCATCYNLERHYNNLNGFREGSDTLPKRFLEEPSTMPGSVGQVCELDKMLEEYYRLRGWVNGVVPEAKLKELEII